MLKQPEIVEWNWFLKIVLLFSFASHFLSLFRSFVPSFAAVCFWHFKRSLHLIA